MILVQTVNNFTQASVKKVWDSLEKANSWNLYKAFNYFNPTRTLLFLKKNIEGEQQHNVVIEEVIKEKYDGGINNDILEILGDFVTREERTMAFQLFFEYYNKRPDLFHKFYACMLEKMNIDTTSQLYEYIIQIEFLKEIKERSKNWNDHNMVILFIETAKEYLKFSFHPTHFSGGKIFTRYNIRLKPDEGVQRYRRMIWEYLVELLERDSNKDLVKEVLEHYNDRMAEGNKEVLSYDLPYIEKIMREKFPNDTLENCILAERLYNIFSRKKIETIVLKEYFLFQEYRIYHLLSNDYLKENIGYEERKNKKKNDIAVFLSTDTLQKATEMINVGIKIRKSNLDNFGAITSGLQDVFEIISKDNNIFLSVVKEYLKKGELFNFYPSVIVKNLLTLLQPKDVYLFLKSEQYQSQNEWLYHFFNLLPEDNIDKFWLEELYKFLNDDSDKLVQLGYLRDIEFLNKFNKEDKRVLLRSCRIIFDKRKYLPSIVKQYFDLMLSVRKEKDIENLLMKFDKDKSPKLQ